MSVAASTSVTVDPTRFVHGELRVPGDKSISHRYAILASLAEGTTHIHSYAPGADCAATLECLAALGVSTSRGAGPADAPSASIEVVITGRGLGGLSAPERSLDVRNSGSTIRMLAGVLAGHPFATTLTGDSSIRRRPMNRVIAPLELMGASIRSSNGYAPLTITGTALQGITYAPPVPSAQVKTAVLLAGLHATGRTTIVEPAATRDHTELALRRFGAEVVCSGLQVSLEGGQRLRATDLTVPGDPSSAAFWAAAAAALPESEIELVDVGLNRTRLGFLDVMRRMGASIELIPETDESGEPRGRIRVRHGAPRAIVLSPDEVPATIDELPVLAALATAGGSLTVTGAAELRTKESDRISALVAGLRALGAQATELPDGFQIDGSQPLAGGVADACGDHRLAMAFAVAALAARRPSVIMGAEAVNVSYPGFFGVLTSLCG